MSGRARLRGTAQQLRRDYAPVLNRPLRRASRRDQQIADRIDQARRRITQPPIEPQLTLDLTTPPREEP